MNTQPNAVRHSSAPRNPEREVVARPGTHVGVLGEGVPEPAGGSQLRLGDGIIIVAFYYEIITMPFIYTTNKISFKET